MGALDPSDPLYDAFRRDDRYGALGWEPQPILEYIRLLIAGLTLVPLKFLGCVYFVSLFYTICRLSPLLPARSRALWVQRAGCFCARMCCLCVGITHPQWVVPDNTTSVYTGLESSVNPRIGAIVCNHCSYIDILVLMSRFFPSFVARSNTQDMPLIGLCSQHLQCIFVDREFKKKGDVKGAAVLVKERMQRIAAGEDSRPVLLFPEGTTTNGKTLLPFKTGAFLAGVPVQPCIIKYGSGRVSLSWDSISVLWHVFLVFATLRHTVTVTLLPIYVPSKEEKEDPHLYANNVRKLLMEKGGFGSSEASLVDSRAYIAMLQGAKIPSNSKAGQELARLNGRGDEAVNGVVGDTKKKGL